jgi:nucleoside-diphosphate-sugar epimerase
MELTLRNGDMQLEGHSDPGALSTIRKVMRKLRPLGLPLNPIVTKPGRGFHSGGTLPMRAAPASLESDILGRPTGFERVHVVDASVLPTIPATTITYTAMANAHRIASSYAENASRPRAVRQRVAITGANGYVGAALAAYFRRSGFEVIPFVRNPHGPAQRFALGEPVSPEAFRGINVVVHAAYDFSIPDLKARARLNIEGTRQFIAAAQAGGVRHGVVISTLSAFPGCASKYGQTKLAIEAIAAEAGWDVVRPGLVFGPKPGGMVASLLKVARRRVVPLVGSGRQLQYLAHQEDLGRLVHFLLTNPATEPRIIPAANPQPMSLRDIVAEMARKKPHFVPVPSRLIWAGLRTKEAVGLSGRLSSDSLVGLVSPTPLPAFDKLAATGVAFRPFARNQITVPHESSSA